MGIAQGATPYLMIIVEGYDLTDAQTVSVAFLTGTERVINMDKSRVTISSDDEGSLLVIHLKQEETLSLTPNMVMLQVRWKDAQGESHTTRIAQVDVEIAIYKGVI